MNNYKILSYHFQPSIMKMFLKFILHFLNKEFMIVKSFNFITLHAQLSFSFAL